MSDPVRHPEFAAKLRSARRRSGKSQERIAAEVGTSRRHWIRWENGDHIPSPDFLTRIGAAVGQPDEFQPPPDDDDAESRAVALVDHTEMLAALAVALYPFHPERRESGALSL